MASEPPFLARLRKAAIGTTGRKSEQRLAKALGARLTPNSGALAGAKGDMKLGSFLIEAKSTVNDSLGLKFAWLAKIAREARETGKRPALALSFTTADGRAVTDGEWVCLPRRVFEDLLDQAP